MPTSAPPGGIPGVYTNCLSVDGTTTTTRWHHPRGMTLTLASRELRDDGVTSRSSMSDASSYWPPAAPSIVVILWYRLGALVSGVATA